MTQLSEAFVKVCELGLSRGVENLNAIAGCWEQDVDGDWHIALNPHPETNTTSDGYEVPPFGMTVKHKGFPVGVVGPYGGAMLCEAESGLIAALDFQLERAASN